MKFSRRTWGVVGLLVGFVIVAPVLQESVFLFGAAGLLAWLLAYGYRFVSTVRWLESELVVEQTATTPTFVDEGRTYVLAVTLPRRVDARVRVTPRVPVAGDASIDAVTLAAGETEGAARGELTWRIAGEHRLRRAAVHVTDRWGLFETSFRSGTTPTVRADPPRPQERSIAEGGASLLSILGRQEAAVRGSGLDLGEVREYVPGDSMTRIDWKATARLNGLHVREFESETAVITTIVLDARSGMHSGPEGSTKFDYLRQVALALVGESRASGEPVGLYVVDDAGTTGLPARATREQYERLRQRLYAIRPPSDSAGAGQRRVHRRSPQRTRRLERALTNDESRFARTLRPYLEDTGRSAAVGQDALFRLIRSGQTRPSIAGGGTVLTVLLTDDTDRDTIRQSARLARRRDGHVVVFMTPASLFEADDPDAVNVASTYERIREFDRFKQELNGITGVSAFEVGPGQRLERTLREAEERRIKAVNR